MPQQDTSLIRLDAFRADPHFAGINGSGETVVVIDTGIDLNHSFFGADANQNGVADRIAYSYDFSGSNDPNASDTIGHGSNVASIVGSQDTTYTGMAPGCNIIALKVFPDYSTSASNADIQEALDWVVANRATYNIVAVNLSLGTFSNNNLPMASVFSSEFANLASNNCVVAVASGNNYAPSEFQSQGVSSPSSDPNAWSIGAVWDRNAGGPYDWSTGAIDTSTGPDLIASFSQRSTTMTTVFAPGGQITGANYDGGTITYSGTSQATPHIAGLVADMQQLAFQVSGHLMSTADLRTTLRNSAATIVDSGGHDNVFNSGAAYPRVDAEAWGLAILSKLFAGTAGNDVLNGTPSDDAINGAAGDDTLYGVGGNDTLTGGAGNNVLDGGPGVDTVDYSTAPGGVTVSLAAGTASNGHGGTDTLSSIENVTGSAFNDLITDNTQSNVLAGGGGRDGFVFTPGDGIDRITDFMAGATGDQLLFNGVGSGAVQVSDLHYANSLLVQSGGVTHVEGVTLTGANASDTPLSWLDGVHWSYQGTGDFNGDGQSDLLVRSAAGTTSIFLMNGSNVTAATGLSWLDGTHWTYQATGDFNGDGKADILVQNQQSLQTTMMAMVDGNAIAAYGLPWLDTVHWNYQATGDFNGDGSSDLLVRHSGDDASHIFIVQSGNVTADTALPWLDTVHWSYQNVGDFNGDGITDFLVRLGATQDTYVMLAANGNITQMVDLGWLNPRSWNLLGVADYNGDGKSDLLVQTADHSQVDVMLMDGANAVGMVALPWLATPGMVLQSAVALGFEGTEVSYGGSSSVQLLGVHQGDLTAANIASTVAGTANGETLTGDAGNNRFDGKGGGDTLIGNGGYDSYVVQPGCGQTAVVNGGGGSTGPQGELDIGASVADTQLWFSQTGNDLRVQLMGGHDQATVQSWFASSTAQLQAITTADTMRLDSGVAALVSAMAGFTAANPGFDPTLATQAPADPTLQAAIAAAWHH
jgi:Ca2+-binding RTX toxin-like protein